MQRRRLVFLQFCSILHTSLRSSLHLFCPLSCLSLRWLSTALRRTACIEQRKCPVSLDTPFLQVVRQRSHIAMSQ